MGSGLACLRSFAQGPDVTQGSVQAHEVVGRHRVGALQDFAGSRVGRSHLLALLVRKAQHAQHQQLVDLAAVEEVAWALRRDLGLV